jgi:4-phospho-D-threonate 3-dehydrogenase / 4-phospho-D-erythronate 3-dehydrogenase
MNHIDKPIIAITLGDPAGIGPEIILKALKNERVVQELYPVVFGDSKVLRQAMDITGLKFNLQTLQRIDQAVFQPNTIHVVESDIITEPVQMGEIQGVCGRAAFSYIANAIDWTMSGITLAIATAPLNKESLKAGHIPYQDQTEVLSKFTQTEMPMTLFMVDAMRTFFLTRHIPFRSIAGALTIPSVVAGLQRSDQGMRQLGFASPRLALAALNPHGGEHGLFGDEEMTILGPAVEEACRQGLKVVGPIPADSAFHLNVEGHFDAVLSLYHDQGHIATKCYDFNRTIDLTLGLPFLRIAVDHGTAFDIAGKNVANPTSMIECLLACSRYGQQARTFFKKNS